MVSAYGQLEERFHRILALKDAAGCLRWDTSVTMPPGASDTREEQMAALSHVIREQTADPVLGDLLDAAGDEALDPWQSANLREMRRIHLHATAVDEALLNESVRAANRCETIWRQARAESDFRRVQVALERVVAVTQEIAAAKAEAFGVSPYEALLDRFDPGRREADLEQLFDRLVPHLQDRLPRIMDRQSREGAFQPIPGPFPLSAQKALGEKLMKRLGFDFERGRLDVSAHPFSTAMGGDVRITTRYDEDDFTTSIMGVLHETGHALYGMYLPEDWRYQPVGRDCGMTVHETQSLIVEMQAGRSQAFLSYLADEVRHAFGGSGPAWEPENLRRLYHRVEPGYIRVDADEVTYPLHVILRFRLERDLLSGDLAVADLPEAWADGLEALLGHRPPDDRQGCMQDIHWYDGAIGYFPTYTLGALGAAQLFQAAERDEPAIQDHLREGDFTPLLQWLKPRIHAKGSRMIGDDLLAEATGAPLGPDAFMAHIDRRYLGEAG